MSIVNLDTVSVTFPIGSFEKFFSQDRFRTLKRILPSHFKESEVPGLLCDPKFEDLKASATEESFVFMFSEILFDIFGSDLCLDERVYRGKNYYNHTLLFEGGFVAFGGNNKVYQSDGFMSERPETFQVYFDSVGSEKHFRDEWKRKKLRDSLICYGGRLTRTDPFIDDLNGEFSLDQIEDMYTSGAFSIKGKAPKCKRIQEKTIGAKNDGDTVYVGSRPGGKMSRSYEKGKQLGDPTSVWVRHEGELNTNNKRVIDPDCLINLDEFFCSLYPAYADIYEKIKGYRLANCGPFLTYRKTAQSISLDALIRHAKRSYGRLLHSMKENFKFEDSEIVRLLSIPEEHRRLASG